MSEDFSTTRPRVYRINHYSGVGGPSLEDGNPDSELQLRGSLAPKSSDEGFPGSANPRLASECAFIANEITRNESEGYSLLFENKHPMNH